MVFQSELSIGRFDLALVCRALQAKDLIRIDGGRFTGEEVVRVIHDGQELTDRVRSCEQRDLVWSWMLEVDRVWGSRYTRFLFTRFIDKDMSNYIIPVAGYLHRTVHMALYEVHLYYQFYFFIICFAGSSGKWPKAFLSERVI